MSRVFNIDKINVNLVALFGIDTKDRCITGFTLTVKKGEPAVLEFTEVLTPLSEEAKKTRFVLVDITQETSHAKPQDPTQGGAA